jgi:hypothetical protein
MLGLLVIPLWGCGDTSDSGTAGAGNIGGGGTPGTGSAGNVDGTGDCPLADYLLSFAELDSAGDQSPSAGVEVCEFGTDNCATTDAQGRVVHSVCAGEEFVSTFEKEGFAS